MRYSNFLIYNFFIDKSSISAQYLRNGSSSSRNVEIINATRLMKNDSETAKKREELRKRIADTKKKLENVSFLVLH